jgi:pantoate--beta-alanine ligase
MRLVRSIASMQRLSKGWQRRGLQVGLVPTMGFLHAGHLSLVRRASRLAGSRGKVVVSIYVNPTQFGPREDFSSYPRDLSRDLRLCRAEKVDAVFAPRDVEMYPGDRAGGFSTYVEEGRLSGGMEGASRPTHFRGVATVVAKLFNIVRPTVAVFGAKDYQQATIVKRMVRDLNFPLEIKVAPIYREPDGLAMSSRNRYLKGRARLQATVLWRAIERVRAAVGRNSRALPAPALKRAVKRMVEREPGARLDYVEFFDAETLEPASRVAHGTHMALAVFIGKTRLIDNSRL